MSERDYHHQREHGVGSRKPAGILRGLVDANTRASYWIGRRLPHAQVDLQCAYDGAIERLTRGFRKPALIVDVGGGRRCHFARLRPAGSPVRIVAVDVSADELSENRDADECRVADVTEGLPFADGEVDVVAARAVVEHLRDTEAFVRATERVLAPGGCLVMLFPGRFSPASLVNKLLPESVSRALVHALVPDSKGRLGFPAYYDRASLREMRQLLARHGFDVLETRVSYYQSPYFAWFLPFFVLSAAYELVLSALRAENLAATVLIVGCKRSSGVVDSEAQSER